MASNADEYRIIQKVGEYEVLQDEESLDALFSAVRNDSEYREYQGEAMKSALMNDPELTGEASEQFEDMIHQYLVRFRSFFDDDDVFEEFRERFVEDEVESTEEAMDKIKRVVVDEEDPDDVFDGVTAKVAARRYLDEYK